MAQISFDELLAKREQREKDRLKVGNIPVPGTDAYLIAKMPTDSKMLDLFGKFVISYRDSDMGNLLRMSDEAIYACCEQLQDKKLRESLGVSDPLDVVPALFTVPERNEMSESILQFLGLLKTDEDDSGDTIDNPAKN